MFHCIFCFPFFPIVVISFISIPLHCLAAKRDPFLYIFLTVCLLSSSPLKDHQIMACIIPQKILALQKHERVHSLEYQMLKEIKPFFVFFSFPKKFPSAVSGFSKCIASRWNTNVCNCLSNSCNAAILWYIIIQHCFATLVMVLISCDKTRSTNQTFFFHVIFLPTIPISIHSHNF